MSSPFANATVHKEIINLDSWGYKTFFLCFHYVFNSLRLLGMTTTAHIIRSRCKRNHFMLQNCLWAVVTHL